MCANMNVNWDLIKKGRWVT